MKIPTYLPKYKFAINFLLITSWLLMIVGVQFKIISSYLFALQMSLPAKSK